MFAARCGIRDASRNPANPGFRESEGFRSFPDRDQVAAEWPESVASWSCLKSPHSGKIAFCDPDTTTCLLLGRMNATREQSSRRVCFTCLRLMIQSRLARKNVVPSNRRSHSPSVLRTTTIPSGITTRVRAPHASRSQISAGLNQPAFAFPTEKDEVVRAEQALILFLGRIARFLLFEVIESLCWRWRRFHCRGLGTFRNELFRAAATGVVEFHERSGTGVSCNAKVK